uniref:Peptidase M48 domain-containing protein n=2 Tax=Cafeteria roenbergensis TaxID=33653 RepID=A0A7S0JTX7_CAFRO|mmetsp:Transcript_17848/g.67337  ORF Transcript_17848/g.67337 Transcript_17848/m.67337 type:complete len:343 (+) Transcript_17848:58-1086(+)
MLPSRAGRVLRRGCRLPVGTAAAARRWFRPQHAATFYPVVEKTSPGTRRARNLLFGALMVAGAGLASSVEEAPVTGRLRLMVVSEALEDAIGATYTDSVEDGAVDADHRDARLVVSIVERVARAADGVAGRGDRQWRVFVKDSPEVNAYCAPGRVVVVYTGLLRRIEQIMREAGADDELPPPKSSGADMLAAVLSHECAHAVARHSAEKLAWAPFFVFAGLVSRTSPAIGPMVDFGLQLPMSRTMEREADKIGMEIMARACFDLRGAAEFHERIHSGTRSLELLSTHPSDASRVTACRAEALRLAPTQEAHCGGVVDSCARHAGQSKQSWASWILGAPARAV